MSTMPVLLPLLLLALAIGWGFFIGMKRTRARFFVVLVCLIFAIAVTAGLRSVTFAELKDRLDPVIAGSNSETLQDAWEMILDSDTVREAALAGGTALAAPLIFAGSFVAASVVTWVICYIIFIIAAICRAASGRHRRRARPARTVIYATLQWAITLFVLITPVACYLSCLPDMVELAADTGALEAMNLTEAEAREAAENLKSDPLLKVYNALGGKAATEKLTSFEVKGEKTTVGKEVTALTKFGGNLISLSKKEVKNYGTDEAGLIDNISESFGESLLLPSLGGEVIWYATDAWERGETFMGVAKPDLESGETTKMFADAFDRIVRTFKSDARDTKNLREDFSTVADLVEILAKDGVFGAMQESTTDALIDKLSNGSTIKDIVDTLQGNTRFSGLVTDITNIGMRFIAEALRLPENAGEIYKNFTTDIADAVNEIKTSGKTADELADEIDRALDNSGVEFTTDKEVLKLYATTLLEDFEDVDNVTPEDIEDFFKAFETVNPADIQADAGTSDGVLLLASRTGGIYSRLTPEELRNNTMVGITKQFLAYVQSLAKAETDPAVFTEKAKAEMNRLLNQSAKYRTGEKADALRQELLAIAERMKPEAVKEDLVSKASSMSRPETLPSSLVTLDDLLTRPEDSQAPLTDAQKEKNSNAVQKVFAKANELKNALSGDGTGDSLGDLSGKVGSIGDVLDNLSDLSSVGGEKTEKLAKAVLQSETIRKSTGLSTRESNELIDRMTKADENGEKPKFSETFSSLSDGAAVIAKLKNNETVSEEEIHTLLTNMTPQTASALELLITEERLDSMGVKGETNTAVTAELIRNLLAEMGDRKTYADTYSTETAGVAKLFDLAMAASRQSGKTHLFCHGDSDNDSVLGTADEVVAAILDSHMVCRAVDNAVHQGSDPAKVNPFGLKTADPANADYAACKDAIDRYAAAHPDLNPNHLLSIYALFGIAA